MPVIAVVDDGMNQIDGETQLTQKLHWRAAGDTGQRPLAKDEDKNGPARKSTDRRYWRAR